MQYAASALIHERDKETMAHITEEQQDLVDLWARLYDREINETVRGATVAALEPGQLDRAEKLQLAAAGQALLRVVLERTGLRPSGERG